MHFYHADRFASDADSGHIAHRFRSIPHTDSGVKRTVIPEHSAQSGEGKRWLNILYRRC
jgi:hypothetical protein